MLSLVNLRANRHFPNAISHLPFDVCKQGSMDLLGSESSDENEGVSFKINKSYAKNYEKWRKKEERQKLKDRYGDVDSTDSSSEEGEVRSTPQMDKDWLRAYAVVRFKQPRLYKQGERFFQEEAKPVAKEKEKATTLKDHERKFILEKGGVESDDEGKVQKQQGKSYFEEQEEIKKSFQNVLKDSGDEETDGESGGLLMKRQKTAEEQRKEENEYLEWLKGERDELADTEAAAELAPLKAYWNDPSLSEKERVLRDYILNNGYMDQEESDDESDEDDDTLAPNFDAEEEFLETAEEYEHKYNFRHEEPGGDEIKSYPRVIETSVRTKDTRRAEKRKRRAERKSVKKEQRNEEIRLLQRLQREEKMEKLETLRKISHNPDLEYDLEADFDPEEHNKIMQKFFSDGYYGDTEEAGEKPKFEYDATIDEDETDDWWQARLKEENEDRNKHNGINGNQEDQKECLDNEPVEDEPDADDPNFIMDADYDPNRDYKTRKKRGKKYGKKLAEKLPLFDPATKTFDEYIDEYLKDKIDKLPFTYREVVPNDFGLSTEEILVANEKELNAWVSVKKMSTYRSRQEELADKRKFIARSRNVEKKQKILCSLFETPGELSADASKKKKKRKKKSVDADVTSSQPPTSQESVDAKNDTADEADSSTEKALKGQNSEKAAAKTKKRKIADISNGDMDMQETDSEIQRNDGTNVQNPEKKKKKTGENVCDRKESKTDSELKAAVSRLDSSSKLTEKFNIESDRASSNTAALVAGQKKKKKKLKHQNNGELNQNDKKVVKKQKKKKLSISNFSSKTCLDKMTDKREIERQLKKIMSASRLSKYGIGPDAVKSSGKKKKKRKTNSAGVTA